MIETLHSPSRALLVMSDGWYRLDADWRFVDVNPRFEELSGRARADLLGHTFWEVFPDNRHLDVVALAAQSSREHRPVRLEAYSPALHRWVDVTFISDDHGLEAYFRDIDDRRRAEMALQASEAEFRSLSEALHRSQVELESRVADRTRELEQAAAQLRREVAERETLQAQLVHSQRLEAIGRSTGGVAHDFNNLLQVVSANLELLRPLAVAGGETARRQHHAALDSVQRGIALTRSLLAFARKQPLEPELLDTAAVLSDAAGLLRHALDETVVIETRVAAGLWSINADRLQLQNALLNLATNARDAMPGGGGLTLAGSNAGFDPDAATPGQYVCIAVTDTGTGVPSDALDHVFEPFFTTKKEGTGLGLAQVYGFVRQSGGHVEISSQLREGATVSLYLPRADAEVPAKPKASAADPAGDETILVVEDDPLIRSNVAMQLEDLGRVVQEAADGTAALAALAADPTISVMIADLGLPDMDGATMIARARALRPGLRVIVATGRSAKDAVAGSVPLQKPYGSEDLRRALEAC